MIDQQIYSKCVICMPPKMFDNVPNHSHVVGFAPSRKMREGLEIEFQDLIRDYGKWMSSILELYDGVIFARKLWKGVAFA